MALYLRSAHLNILLHLPRPSPLPPLRVSFAEVGSPTGSPVLVFLGLGCVRYLIALYDELAAAYGLRLICIDRWGLGKTDMVETSDRGLMEWAKVVEGVMREIKVERFHVLAHSAGAPYAMAVARRYPEKILGRLHLLAPWVNADVDGGKLYLLIFATPS
jgi:pimeloyl-ACP methyl ester carboxylesterase